MRALRWPSRGFDGVRIGSGDGGHLYVVFDPPWWAIHRWIWWLFSRVASRGRVTVTQRDVGAFEVRCYGAPEPPPRPRIRGRHATH
jgi:hypothetical protein